MNRASDPLLMRDRRGQGLAELALALPVLLLLALGLIEVSRALETSHMLSSLAREGANIASRGSTLEEALAATRSNQVASGLGTEGGVVATRLRVESGLPRVLSQVSTPGFELRSLVGRPDSVASPYVGAGLVDGSSYFVIELFMPYTAITGFDRLLPGIIPEELYDRALF